MWRDVPCTITRLLEGSTWPSGIYTTLGGSGLLILANIVTARTACFNTYSWTTTQRFWFRKSSVGSKIGVSNKLLGAAATVPMGHNFSSTDLQDLERRKDNALNGENSDIRGMNMEQLRQVPWKKISRPRLITSERGLLLHWLWEFTTCSTPFCTRKIPCEQDRWCICNQEASRSSQTINHPVNYRLFPGVVSLEESKTEREGRRD